jgi:hypothetical protein
MANTGIGNAGTILQGAGSGATATYSTATYPSTATGTGKLLRADGTNWVVTTATFPTTAGTSGNILTSDGTNWLSSAPATSGTVTSVTGTANRITSTNGTTPVIDIAATYVGQSSITTIGTIATGVWNATVIGVIYGGTGLTSATQGDIIYASAANTYSALAKNTSSTRYLSNTGSSNNPSWAQVALTTGVSGTLPIANGGTNATSMTTSNGIVKFDGTRLVTSTGTIDASNRYRNASQPCSSAYMASVVSNATGDGTNVTVIFDSEFVDQGNCYNNATGVFTAPIAGNYQYNYQVALRDVGVLNTSGWAVVVYGGGNFDSTFFNPTAVNDTVDNYCIVKGSGIIPMTASATLSITITVNGGTKIVDIAGLSAIGQVTFLTVCMLN